MDSALDRRVVSEEVVKVIKACQRRVPCHLGGGAALSAAHLRHRLSRDIDLFCHSAADVRTLAGDLGGVGSDAGAKIEVVRDAGTFVRASVRTGTGTVDLDVVYDGTLDIEPAEPIEGIVVESFADLRAAKVTCILSRSEPRDLVDLLFLDRAGFPPENDLTLALRKDGGIDAAALAWLLTRFPVAPLPSMLKPLTESDLRTFRDELRERLRRLATPGAP